MLPRGANGLVLEARDVILNRPVAVKIWIPRKVDKRDRRTQALAEASKLAQLNHQNIVQIFSVDELENGYIYSIMEYLKGENLDDYLRINQLDFFKRCRLWNEIDKAISYAHSHDIYHGDLHTRNVRVVNDCIKLIDFGTSIFSNKTIEKSRERKSIFELFESIFPNDKPSLKEMINFDLLSLTPALIFATISAWINLVRMLDEISDVFNEPDLNNPNRIDDILRQRMHILAAEISSAPLLSIEKLKSILNVLGVSSYSQDVFLGFCAVWANRRLSDSEVTYLPEMTMPEVENLLKIIWPKLLTRFLNQGPLK